MNLALLFGAAARAGGAFRAEKRLARIAAPPSAMRDDCTVATPPRRRQGRAWRPLSPNDHSFHGAAGL